MNVDKWATAIAVTIIVMVLTILGPECLGIRRAHRMGDQQMSEGSTPTTATWEECFAANGRIWMIGGDSYVTPNATGPLGEIELVKVGPAGWTEVGATEEGL